MYRVDINERPFVRNNNTISFLDKRYNIIHFSVLSSSYNNDFFSTLQIECSQMFVFIRYIPKV
jgi:hypothetical protein